LLDPLFRALRRLFGSPTGTPAVESARDERPTEVAEEGTPRWGRLLARGTADRSAALARSGPIVAALVHRKGCVEVVGFDEDGGHQGSWVVRDSLGGASVYGASLVAGEVPGRFEVLWMETDRERRAQLFAAWVELGPTP
jgi:hypothetical protein